MTLTLESRPSPNHPRPKIKPLWQAGAASVVVVIVVLLSFLNTGPHKISQVTVVNNTPYDLAIDVSGQATGSTTPLGIVPAKQTIAFPDVIDVGPNWYIHATSQGHDGADISTTRAGLQGNGWRLTFGADVTTKLQQAGVVAGP